MDGNAVPLPLGHGLAHQDPVAGTDQRFGGPAAALVQGQNDPLRLLFHPGQGLPAGAFFTGGGVDAAKHLMAHEIPPAEKS